MDCLGMLPKLARFRDTQQTETPFTTVNLLYKSHIFFLFMEPTVAAGRRRRRRLNSVTQMCRADLLKKGSSLIKTALYSKRHCICFLGMMAKSE